MWGAASNSFTNNQEMKESTKFINAGIGLAIPAIFLLNSYDRFNFGIGLFLLIFSFICFLIAEDHAKIEK